MGGSKPPKPTQEERNLQTSQKEMLDFQRSQMEQQSQQQQMLAPIIYKQNNIAPDYGPDGKITGYHDLGPTPEQLAYKEAINAQMKNLKFSEAMTPLQLRQQGYELQLDADGNPTNISVVPGGQADLQAQAQAAQLKTTNQQYEVNQMQLDRTKKALAGELPVDPGMQRHFDETEAQLNEQMRKQLGSGYATSSPYLEAKANFDKRKSELISAIQHGEIASSEGLALAGQGVQPTGPNPYAAYGNTANASTGLNPFAQAGSPSGRSAQLLGSVDAPFQGSGGFANLAQGYGQMAGQMANNRNNAYQQALQYSGQRGGIWGTIGTGVGTAVGAYFGGPAGAAAGGALGGGVGRWAGS